MAPKSKSAASNPFRSVLDPIEARIDALDRAIREVHPDYSARILDRMTELEALCREHAHRVMRCIDNQKKDLMQSADKVFNFVDHALCDLEKRTATAIERFEEITQRHQTDAKALRRELGELKEIIDSSSACLAEERKNCEQLLEDARQLLSTMEDSVVTHESSQRISCAKERLQCEQLLKDARLVLSDLNSNCPLSAHRNTELGTNDFLIAQRKLISEARDATSDGIAHVIRRAQSAAASRSPSRRASRETSPARSVVSDKTASDTAFAASGVRCRVSRGNLSGHHCRGRSSDSSFRHAAPMSVIPDAQPHFDNVGGGEYTQPCLQLPPVIPSVPVGGLVVCVTQQAVHPSM